tara:strand:- start:224 stop:1300 length:1077 start_codon:yes stop_codon:yes gene_type:complete
MDWKDFLIQNPWAPPRYLKERFPDFDEYDLSNWEKKNNVRLVLNRSDWKVSKSGMSKNKARKILKAVWEFRITNQFNIKLNSKDVVPELISQTIPRDDALSSFVNANYLRQTGFKYDAWLERGYTQFSFICFHIFPGKEWCESKSILPQMFFQTKQSDLSDQEVLVMMENIWLKHLKNLTNDSSQDDIDLAKKIFVARHNDDDLLDRRRDWERFGLGANIQRRKSGIKSWEKLLANKFISDLGLNEDNLEDSERWSSSKFKKKFPNMNTTKCLYTNSIPTELHHLLPRAEYPELIYDEENVVTITPSIHAFITRGKWDKSLKKEYLDCQQKWLQAPKGLKKKCFDEVMEKIIDAMNPN